MFQFYALQPFIRWSPCEGGQTKENERGLSAYAEAILELH